MASNPTQPTADMSPYAEGSLHFAVKGSAAGIGVMLCSPNQGSGTAPLINLADKGYPPDGEWHEITVPISGSRVQGRPVWGKAGDGPAFAFSGSGAAYPNRTAA